MDVCNVYYGDSKDSNDDNTECIPNTNMQKMWNSKMAVASMVPNVTMLILNAVFGHRYVGTILV